MLRTRLAFRLVALLVATLVPPLGAAAQTPTPRPSPAHLDHFVSYGVKLSKGSAPFVPLGPVALPRLGGGPYDLLKVRGLWVPADAHDAGTRDPATHLVEYRLKASKGRPKFTPLADVRVSNQCGDVFVELTKPVAALVPTADVTDPMSAASDAGVDHLLCFQAKTQRKGPSGAALPKFPKGVQVEVADRFQRRRYQLTKVTRLCVPTTKSGTPVFLKGADKGKPAPLAAATVAHPDEHLLCYQARLATTEVPQLGCGPAVPGAKGTKIPKQPKHAPRLGVLLANQLGTLRLDTTKEIEVCVPSFTELPIVEGLTALPGDPGQLVSAATFDLSRSPAWTDAEITVDGASGARMLRTRLGIFFTDEATVGAANAILARLGAEIVMMIAGPPYVVVRIPDPGSLDALTALAAEIDADPAVASVSLDSIPEPDVLPSKFPLPGHELPGDERVLYEERLGYVDHLLAARAASAWNARDAIFTAPSLVIADAFGEGVPGAEIAADYLSTADFAVGRPDPVRHGYQVLGVIAAAFEPPGGPANCFAADAVPGPATLGCATGIYPAHDRRPRIRAVDMRRFSWNALEVEILLAVKSLKPQRVVVNASIARRAGWGSDDAARVEGRRWRDLVQGADLASQFLLVAAAGNVLAKLPNERSAMRSSSFTAAALHPDLQDPGDDRTLSNTLVVENRKASGFPFRPGAVHEESKRGGHLSACGTDVWTVVEPPPGQAGWGGTSFAAPQVAGVAAYVLAIAPELSIAQVRQLLLDNAQGEGPPALDAYATLVGIDRLTGDFRVRRALLDFAVSEPKAVNAEDVSAFFAKYDLPADQRRYGDADLLASRDPTDPPRFDLNADGKFETIDAPVGARQVSFDEAAMELDADVMCYAAFARTPYDDGMMRVDAGRERCCEFFKQGGRFPAVESCFDCPTRRRAAHPRDVGDEPRPVGVWRLSPASGLVVFELFFLEDGTVMTTLATSGLWEKSGTWTSTRREGNGEIFYDVRIDPCTDAIQKTRYAFEGTWSPRPVTDCFGVESCVDGDGCPAMQGLLTTTDGITSGPPVAVDSKRVQGSDGWAPLNPPVLHLCHGGCFEPWWRSGLLVCSPQGQHCLEQTAPSCGGFCLPGSTCMDAGGACTCVTTE